MARLASAWHGLGLYGGIIVQHLAICNPAVEAAKPLETRAQIEGGEGIQLCSQACVHPPAVPHAGDQGNMGAGAASCSLSESTHSSGLTKVGKKDRQGVYATDSGLKAAAKSHVEL